MLPSLGIRNYRNLKSLNIEKLARVNLIAGKNNTGKTSLLEAVSMYAASGNLGWIDSLLKNRGEFYSEEDLLLESNRRTYASLFHNRNVSFLDGYQIVVGPLYDVNKGFQNAEQLHESLKILFVKMVEETVELVEVKTDRKSVRRQWRPIGDKEQVPDVYRLAIGIFFQREDSGIYILDDIQNERMIRYSYQILAGPSNYQFVRTYQEANNYAKWSDIALTEKDDYVIQALQIIDTDVEKLAFIESDKQQRAVVKLKSNKERVSLQSMGDGMNRILTIILALVNAGDGYLFIDEFENGLHYTVQEDLWRMIFQLAKELNVQVFATTHSDDCIHAFANVLNSEENQSEGQYFRLERFDDIIKPIFYSPSALEAAADQHIETR